MSIRFAAAGSGQCMVVACVLQRPRLRMADNDVDHGASAPICQDASLVHALRHFARHGLDAANEAGRLARQARRQGDTGQYQHWLGVCRHLDRRMAERIASPARRGGR